MTLKVTKDNVKKVLEGISQLQSTRVLVGIPQEDNARQGSGITNSALGYIHEHGAPEANLPARPFLVPGVAKVHQNTARRLRAAGAAALDGKPAVVLREMAAAGQEAVNSVQATIRAGIPPPLKPATVKARQRRSKGSKYRRKAAVASQTTPLIDTGQLLRSITYVMRKR
jgi:hypothetical protein